MRTNSPRDIRLFCSEIGFRPLRRLGQVFLIDANIADIIVNAVDSQKVDSIVEIGPGMGILTERLFKAGSVDVIEIDKRLISFLQQRFEIFKHIRFYCLDALDTIIISCGEKWYNTYNELLPYGKHVFKACKLVSNLPYSIASRLLIQIAGTINPVEYCVVMVQRELGERLLARPCSKEWGFLTIVVSLVYHVEKIKDVSRNCFWPKPEVDSTILILKRRDKPLIQFDEFCILKDITKKIMCMRRKKLLTAMRRIFYSVDKACLASCIAEAGLKEDIRVDEIDIDGWCSLVHIMSSFYDNTDKMSR